MKCINTCLVIASLLLLQTPATQSHMPNKDLYQKLAAEMETTLHKDVLDVWFPRSIDKENGGFYSNFTRDWQRTTSEGKFSVFQGRMVWVASELVIRRPKEATYRNCRTWSQVPDGCLWDKETAASSGLDENNKISSRYTIGKHLYGISLECMELPPPIKPQGSTLELARNSAG